MQEEATDRRRHPRARYQGVAVLTLGEMEVACQAGNLSASGMLVYPPMTQPPVETLQVKFTLPDLERWLEVEGRLARCRRETAGYVWGVHFTRVLPDDQGVIELFVEEQIRLHGPFRRRPASSETVIARPSYELPVAAAAPLPDAALDEEPTVQRANLRTN